MTLRTCAIASVSLFALACGGKSSAPTTTTTTPGNTGGEAAAYPAPTDQALFKAGTSWTLTAVSHSSFMDDQDPAADATGVVRTSNTSQVTCAVAEVRAFASGVLSRIDCDAELSVGTTDPLAGWWAATAAGLWHLADEPAAEPTLDASAIFLSATPVAEERRNVLDEEMEHAEIITTSQEGAAWCVANVFAAGDEAWSSLCLDAIGPVRGSGGWAGGAEQEVTFTRNTP